ncbi:DUF6234 family protein [Streptomyces collinus]|uniref:DUF6234 family protein n=1 Tax=Streptomyces collinus TaxID=42684 RepID=UPI0036836802
MTDILSAPPARRRPWSRSTPLGVDLAFAVPLFLLETAWLALDWIYGTGLEVWAAQGDRARIDAADLAHMGRVRTMLIAVVVLAVLAALFRARWTVVVHLVLALLAGAVLTASHQEWTEHHTPPAGCVRYRAGC